MTDIAHAATVVTLRQRNADTFELFMVKRHGRSGFMAGAHVYPGGKLDDHDTSEAAAALSRGLTPRQAHELMQPAGTRLADDEPLTPAQALGLYFAAIREVFEEAGLLLARDPSNQIISLSDPDVAERFGRYRRQLNEGELALTRVATDERLTLETTDLHYFAHWITPEVEARRFNTRFFLARAPEGQQALHDNRETVASSWMSPGQAIDAYRTGVIQLAPPTLRTLEDLAAFETVDAAMRELGSRPMPAIMPRFEQVDGNLTLLLPGDELYPSDAPVDGPTRVTLKNGRWWSS